MSSLTRTIRIALVAGAALALISPAAQAQPIGSGGYAGGYRPTDTIAPMHVTARPMHVIDQQLSLNRVDRVGMLPHLSAYQLPPDGVDGVGTLRQQTPVSTSVVVTSRSKGFDWADAAIGAGCVLAVVLGAAAALAIRGRRRVALST